MNFVNAVKHTFKNMDALSVQLIYIGLDLTVGLLAVAILVGIFAGRSNDYFYVLSLAKGLQDAALSTGVWALIAAFLCDVAVKDRKRR